MEKIMALFKEHAIVFKAKLDEKMTLSLMIEITDNDELIDIIISKGEIEILPPQKTSKDLIIKTDTVTLLKIFEGKLEAFTAAGKADMNDKAPLDWRIGPSFSFDKMDTVYYFLTHFFNKKTIKEIKLGETYSRLVHGANAIPLFYHSGMRSAWYMVKKGEQMNEIGDTNPFDQGIIILSGQGMGKIGEDTIKLEKNRAYHIPKNSDHVIWNNDEEPLVMIWLAWGPNA